MWWWWSGCFHAGLHVRPGEVVPPGTTALEADGTPLTVAPASLDVGSDEIHATFGARQMVHPMMALFLPTYSVGAGLRVGVVQGLEATVDLAAQEATAGLRVALAPHLALSASGGVYPSWFPVAPNPRGTLTLDGSSARVRASLGASVGEQVYVGFVPARLVTPCGGFGDPGCGEYSPGPAITARRTEARLVGALGVSVPVRDDDGPSAVTLALVPWATLAKLGATDLAIGRARGAPSDFAAAAGGSVVIGLEWGPFEPRDRWWLEEDRLRGPPGGDGAWTHVEADGSTDAGSWKGGRRHGAFVARTADGSPSWERSYRRGALHGPSRSYWPDGTLQEAGDYRRGRHVGEWRGYYEDGRPRYVGTYTRSGNGPWVSWDEAGTETRRGD